MRIRMMLKKKFKVYNSDSIKNLCISISLKRNITYWAFVNCKWKRISKEYYLVLAKCGVEIIVKNSKKTNNKTQPIFMKDKITSVKLANKSETSSIFYSKSKNLSLKKKSKICKLIYGDCFMHFNKLKTNTIDAVISDLPYNISNNSWDIEINLSNFWEEILRVLKQDGIVILTATSKFASKLIQSNFKMYKYDLIWVKSIGSNQLNIKHQPLRMHEQILIFYKKLKTYNEQLIPGEPYKIKRHINKTQGFGPQKLNFKTNLGIRHATSTLNIANPRIKNGHPTEKPVQLLEYLVKTYTNKGDLILDPFMGCGSTGVACTNLNRKFIGIEKELKYYKTAFNKING